LPDALSEIFSREGLDNPNQIEAPQQIEVLAQAIVAWATPPPSLIFCELLMK
jgi:hypothetical protein